MDRQDSCDLLVIGSGAAGLAAAVTAAHHGLQVILAEKATVLGGTSAWSGGWMWVPGNPLAIRAGIIDPPDAPRRYLQAVLGDRFDGARISAFLTHAPQMVGFFESQTAVQFESGSHIPDTYGDQPGAGTGGRSVIAAPYDGRHLGRLIQRLRKPLRETTFIGMTIQSGADLRAFMTMTRSWRAFWHVTRRMTRHLWDLAVHRRGMQLRNGNALVARLLRSAADLGVDLRVEHGAQRLLKGGNRVAGAVLETPEGTVTITARRGVVLATGGFAHDTARRNALFPSPAAHRSLAVPTATGDGARMAQVAGARFDASLAAAGAWCPVSAVPFGPADSGSFPHIIDRGKPGVIGVLANGQRFCNEGLGYHDYVTALFAATRSGDEVASWLICDHRFIRRYGLGMVRPAPLPLRPWLRSGYLKTGGTLDALARACGIDADGLRATVTTFNADARQGEDRAFGRGRTPYMRLQGDASQRPNPCMAPIEAAPFYAVKVIPGSFGTFAGLHTDARARVVQQDGTPIAGLYAAGCDMASVMGGYYPAGGINLGPAMTFGHIAGLHAAGQLQEPPP